MTDEAHDMALAALIASASAVAADLPAELIRKIYAIQRRHQFNRDRAEPVEEMRRLIEEHVASLPPHLLESKAS
jgi:hypothetical protein